MSQPVAFLQKQFRRRTAGRWFQGCGHRGLWWTDCDKIWSPSDWRKQGESRRKRSVSQQVTQIASTVLHLFS